MHVWCAYYEKGSLNVLIIQGIIAVSVLQAHMTCSLIIREQELCFSYWRCCIASTDLLDHVPVGLQRELGLEGQGKLVKQVSRRLALVALPLQGGGE